MDLPLTPSIDPNHVLSGNFAPVAELPPTACEVVEGSLPACLDGAYIRNGPNPQFIPRGPYHLLDGDGMLHSIRISGGEAYFCSRYVKTYKFITEGNEGYAFFPSPFSSFNGVLASAARFCLAVARGIFGYFDPIVNGFGTANTSLAFFGGSVYALCESDLPYEIEVTWDGEIVTLGRRHFGGDSSLRMTAHPKIDSDTGEVFAFRCNMFSPYLTFFRIDSAGRKGPDLPVSSFKKTPCVHDFALTKRFIIFQDGQIEMEPAEIGRGRTPLVCDRGKVPRIGILPRHADAQVLWIEAPGLNMLHVINAWEEYSGDRIVIVAPNFLSVEDGFHNTNLIHSVFEIITLDIKEKKLVSRHVLRSNNMEFGVINQAYAGEKNKYLYAAVIAEMPKAAGMVKLDLSIATAGGGDCTVASREYGSGCYGGESYFVAREAENPAAEEDDGYLVTYVHDENSMESWFWVMDAKSPTLEIIARVKLPGRVPYGFHGLFVPEDDLK
ncbi:nine-cis-epoxycarotenoid dioxygenase 4 [Perilla frutescens var. hirtella]|uniref:Nine-cis-epoxycarotenoid dioxygenase 4 n=1 Tax=Perilla frutescens var. hirtella TaxID=608512 RepID=A0AAD4ISD5_PERFH|nr:nine-cis-epoxycarotenoid dioxygenase 4 [Perilla frutescens var. hirtella]